MIVERLTDLDQSEIRIYPVQSNRASQLGHECLRYLVYERTRWADKKLPDIGLQRRFSLGNWFERMVIERMARAGLSVVEQQRPYYLPEYNITGHIDGKVIIDGKGIPFDVKSTSPQTLASISTIEDMRHHRHHYIRMYPAQMQLYLHMGHDPVGLFLFVDRLSGNYLEVPLDYDEDEARALLAKANEINKHVADGTLPEPITYDEGICGECGYRHICGREVSRDGIVITDDGEMDEMITRWSELKPMATEYRQLDELIKERVRGIESAIVGQWLIRGRWVETVVYDIPQEVRDRYAERRRIWRKEIIRL